MIATQSRRRMLIKAVHDAALELATRALATRADGVNPKPEMLAISAFAIFELVRLTIPDVTPDEVQDAVMQSLPYMGGRRQ
jgi:hypothetical protein